MTTYTVFGGSIPAGTSAVSAGARTDGIQFTVSETCLFEGWWYYLPPGSTTTGSSYAGNLWTTTNASTGTLVTGPVAGSGTWTTGSSGAWNFLPLASPVTLYPGVTYVAAVTSVDGLQFLHAYYATGNPGAGGLTSGPISVPGVAGAVGGIQQPFVTGSGFPNQISSGGTWYGVDISVTTPGLTLFRQTGGGGVDSTTQGYTLGTHFTLSAPATLNGIWWYSVSGVASLPGIAAIFNNADTSVVVSTSTPQWSGPVGAGWVFCPLTATLPAGSYVTAVTGKNDGNEWYSITFSDPGAQTNGILSCPSDPCCFSSINDGTLQWPGNGYGNIGIWVDVDVTASGGGATVNGSAALSAAASLAPPAVISRLGAAHLAGVPSLAAAAVLARQGAAHLAAVPSVTAQGVVTKRGASALLAPGTLTAAPVVSRTGHAALSASPALSGTGRLSRVGLAALAAPGTLHGAARLSVLGTAPLAAFPSLFAQAAGGGTSPDSLWVAYLAAQQKSQAAWQQWHMMRQAGGTDGSAGFLFGQAYEAQRAAEAAYEAWRAAQAAAYPGVTG